MKSIQSKADRFKHGNDDAASIILSDPDKWGGKQSALVQWARMHLETQSKLTFTLANKVGGRLNRNEGPNGNHAEEEKNASNDKQTQGSFQFGNR